jgi:hypothetical protein
VFSLPFLLPVFAIAGLVAAAGPVLIHLLNRRRYRVIHWAAMDFLREAIFRSRRMLQLRDLLLMALRMLCLVAFGAALARPYWNRSDATPLTPDQPVHAVILVDNSLSMAYQTPTGSLLDAAKAKVPELLDRLPPGSRISLLPTCGIAGSFTAEPWPGREEALKALARIEVVDRPLRPTPTIDLAIDACKHLPSMPGKQLYLVTNQQVNHWPGEALQEHLKRLPVPMEVVQVAADFYENAWVADFALRDGMADSETPGVFTAKIGFQGTAPRHGVQVTLTVDGVTVAAETVDLQPGQLREVQFPPYRFEATPEPGKPAFVVAQVSIPADRLPLDDQRFLVVPVLAAVPVVFVDQHGTEEDLHQNRRGDTFWLRHLLAPLTDRSAQQRQWIQIRHVKMEQLSREVLADARLVVIAGVADPKGSVPLLQEYVEQGGNLVLAAGGDFDPAAWTREAWLDGNGILPVPLEPTAVGQLPSEAGSDLKPLLLDFDSLVHQYFWPEGASEQEVRDSLGPQCLFFKAMAARTDDQVLDQAANAAAEHVRQQQAGVGDLDHKIAALDQEAGGRGVDAARRAEFQQQRTELERQRAVVQPNWLLWRSDREDPAGDAAGGEGASNSAERAARRARPVVLGRFQDNRLPFMVARRWGRGQVLLLTVGVSPEWTNMLTLPATQGGPAWVFDHVFRSLLGDTLPRRSLETEERLVLSVPAAQHNDRIALVDPDGQEQPLTVDALGGDRYGVKLADWTRRGMYRITAVTPQESGSEAAPRKRWEIPLAVNGPADESDFAPLGENEVRRRGNQPGFLDVTQTSAVTLEAAPNKDLWQWALLAALVCLLLELAMLAWTSLPQERSA